MSILSKLFGKKSEAQPSADQQAVLVYLDGQGLPDDVYKKYDLSTLEDQLIEVIDAKSLGEFDGNEIGPTETLLYMYAPNAEALFIGIEPTLRAYPLCRNARIVIRQGGPGAQVRELYLPKA